MGRITNGQIDIEINNFVPTRTLCSNICYIFKHNTSYVLNQLKNDEEEAKLLKCMETAFDDPATSDFTITGNNRHLFVHKSLLKFYSRHRPKMLPLLRETNNKNMFVDKKYSYNVYKCFIKYIYTGKVNLPFIEVLELLRLAHDFCIESLQHDCTEIVKEEMTLLNFIVVYNYSLKYNFEVLEATCIKYALNHLPKVIRNLLLFF